MKFDLPSFNLDQRVVIVTGAAGLLGEPYAHALAGAGARVVVSDLNAERVETVARDITANGGQALAIATDVSSKSSVEELVAKVLDEWGQIDGLLNNAAIDPKFDDAGEGRHQSTFENYPIEMFNKSLAVNISGMFLMAQAVAPVMRRQDRGAIVNVSSTYGLNGPDQRLYIEEGDDGPQRYKPADYSVTKSSVLGFTRYLAAYYARTGIRVNTLTLGGVFNNHDAGFNERYSARTILGRMARRDEYAGAVVFLFSDASSYMTGSNLIVDGGWTAW